MFPIVETFDWEPQKWRERYDQMTIFLAWTHSQLIQFGKSAVSSITRQI